MIINFRLRPEIFQPPFHRKWYFRFRAVGRWQEFSSAQRSKIACRRPFM